MKRNKEFIKRMAEEIVQIELDLRLDKNAQDAMSRMENIMTTHKLDLEDMLRIDEYILKNNLLTK